jgi:hypothetical protein
MADAVLDDEQDLDEGVLVTPEKRRRRRVLLHALVYGHYKPSVDVGLDGKSASLYHPQSPNSFEVPHHGCEWRLQTLLNDRAEARVDRGLVKGVHGC